VSLLRRKFINVWTAATTPVSLVSLVKRGASQEGVHCRSLRGRCHPCVMLVVVNESMLNISSAA
jgi:hypothetical protein